jgi:adenylate cyclase
MPDLIAQGTQSHQRWRHNLRVGERFVLGRDSGSWSVPWDEHVSRQHAELCWQNGRLEVSRLKSGRNPIFLAGKEAQAFELHPGEHFVIGDTSFTLVSDRVAIAAEVSHPVEEQTFSSQYLQRIRFHNADHRIDVLTRLPDVISGAVDDTELFVRLVNMLLAGIPRASTAALVMLDNPENDRPKVNVLHWDRRLAVGGDFQPSHRLVAEAVGRGESVLHVWGPTHEAASTFTMTENIDWAFCTPVGGEACHGWALYVAGRFLAEAHFRPKALDSDLADHEAASPTDLREDLKFAELVSATIRSLRQVQMLQRKQATLSQFFAPAVLQAMATENPDVVLAPRETEVSVLFCDLRGFSLQSERSADNLLGLLNRVSKALGVMTHHILDQGGVFGDFQGDAAMGFWGWPLPQADKIQRACLAALAIRHEFETAARQPDHPLADFRVGIGIATGKAVAGRIGTTDQVKVTVFGPLVNRASRLEGMTKILQTPILLDEATAKVVCSQVPSDLARCRRLAVVKPYGMNKPIEVSELLPPVAEYPDLSDEDLKTYEQALDSFLAGQWNETLELLHRVPAKDRVKDFLTVFIAEHNRTPPANWNGVIPLSSKS